VSKQRPSKIASRKRAGPLQPALNGFQAAYWRRRLFKNSFTRDGQRTALKGWSVKIQHQGRRRTFSLAASNREAAAREAWQIYRSIVSPDRAEVSSQPAGIHLESASVPPQTSLAPEAAKDASYWKARLVHRKYLEFAHTSATKEFSVRVEHAGTSHFFPLGTSNENEAARNAMHIHQTVVNEGWTSANAAFPRELSLALRWQENPLAWTYTTIHTRRSSGPIRPANDPARRSPQHSVALIEPDAGLRFALASHASGQDGFRCDATFAGAAEALREIPRRRVELALANHDLPDKPEMAWIEELQRVRPGLVVLFYSVFEDADQLFKSAPGGSVVYKLNRTSPCRLFEPIADLAGPITQDQVASRVRNYFQKLSALLPSGPPFWKLAKLTPREHEILALLSRGDLVKEIADTLGISNWTVQGHVKNIFEKLNVHTRTEAVIKYLQK
jgi:DNA-binding NarL/FixJ family response regulator